MAKKTVLIADNSVINRTLLAGILSDEYQVVQAADGVEALATLREKSAQISVVLLDLMMPKKDGYQVLVEKAFDSSIVNIPVITLSASSETSTELRALNAGAIDFLAKPLDPEIVKRRVKLAIDQRELEALHIQNRIYEERQYAADHDALTGIYSKAAFYRETRELLDSAEDGAEYFVLRWDIEKFKLINSLFGLEMGDRVLKVAATSLKNHVGDEGTYGRYESDNFVACIRGSAKDVEALTASIVEDLRNSFEDAGLTQTLIIAAGAYQVTDKSLSVEEMCDRAALAQRTTKGDYTLHLAFYDEALRNQLLEEQDILDNMERALAEGEFEVYLQPVYSMATEHVSSAEALVRWNRPGQGIVSPGVFIPLFERNGFISVLDRKMWEQVCQMLADRKKKGEVALPVSVNVSRRSLYNPYLAEEIESLTKQYDIEPELLRIEITESAYMDNAAQLVATVEKLQQHGFFVLMDDFGSGYSSLNTLKDIPVDMLKMDMRFMEGFDKGGRVGTVMASVLRMAKWLGVPVIAEGVETYDQYTFLRSLGCEYAQGYYMARPMPYSEFEQHLARNEAVPKIPDEGIAADTIDQVMGSDLLTPRILDALFDAYAVFEYSGDMVEVLRANSGYFDLFGYDVNSFKSKGNLLVDRISADDYRKVLAACEYAVEQGRTGKASIAHPQTGADVFVSSMALVNERDDQAIVLLGFLCPEGVGAGT